MADVRIAALRDLSERECLGLLATVDHGRLATTERALPAIVPVRLRLVDDEVFIVSLLGKIVCLQPTSVVSLQAGPLGERSLGQWTVEVRGFLHPSKSRSEQDGTEGLFSRTDIFSVTLDHLRGWSTS